MAAQQRTNHGTQQQAHTVPSVNNIQHDTQPATRHYGRQQANTFAFMRWDNKRTTRPPRAVEMPVTTLESPTFATISCPAGPTSAIAAVHPLRSVSMDASARLSGWVWCFAACEGALTTPAQRHCGVQLPPSPTPVTCNQHLFQNRQHV